MNQHLKKLPKKPVGIHAQVFPYGEESGKTRQEHTKQKNKKVKKSKGFEINE